MINNENALFGDELLVSVFAQFPPDRRSFRLVSESAIVEAFYNARQHGGFEELLANYTFHTDAFGARSKQISEGLDTLQQSGLLGRMNPFLVNYTVQSAVDYRYRRFIEPKIRSCPEMAVKIRELAEFVSDQIHGQLVNHDPAPAH